MLICWYVFVTGTLTVSLLNCVVMRAGCWRQYLCHFPSLKEGEEQKDITIEPAPALDEVEPLPEDCYSRPISLPEGKRFVRSSLSGRSDVRWNLSLLVSFQWPRCASGCCSLTSSPRGRPSSTPGTNTSSWSARCAAGSARFHAPVFSFLMTGRSYF